MYICTFQNILVIVDYKIFGIKKRKCQNSNSKVHYLNYQMKYLFDIVKKEKCKFS